MMCEMGGLQNHLTTTVFWFFTTAFSVFFNIKNIHSGSYLKNLFVDQFKISVVLEFFVHLYSFPIWIELVFVPLLSILTALLVYASYKSEYVDVKGFLENVLFVLFCYLLYKAIRLVFFSSQVSSMTILNDVIIIPILSISLIPFGYLLGLFTAYENFFIQILFSPFDSENKQELKRKTFIRINIHLNQILAWQEEVRQYHYDGHINVDEALDKFFKK